MVFRMAIQKTNYEHIVIQNEGVPIIDGTFTKVIELVREVQTWGWSPEELCYQHAYLTLGQVHSALAYYWDHKEELDADLARRSDHVQRMQQDLTSTPVVVRLKNQQ